VLSDVDDTDENKKGTFLLGAETDEAYLRRWYEGGIWQMAIKLVTFIVDSVASNIIGRFRVFRSGENTGTGKPVFDANPGAAAGGEETEVRGAFRVRKSTADGSEGDEAIFEALPNGQTRVQNLQKIGNVNVYRNYYEIDTSALDISKFYFISFGSFDFELDCEIHSPGVHNTEPYNQNRIHFLLGKRGWDDSGNSFTVLSYYKYDSREVTIGAVVCGDHQGEKGIYVRGGLVYRIKCNATPVLHETQYAYVSEVYPSGVAIDNWAGTYTSTIWTYNDTPYSGDRLRLGIGTSFIRLNDDMIELYQGGEMKTRISVTAVLLSGLLTACGGVLSQGDIKEEIPNPDPPTTWTAVGNTKFGTSTIAAIAYGANKFVAVGTDGKMAYSADGINWTAVGDPKFGTSTITAIAYGANKFVAVGADGKMAYSADGINWTAISDPKFGTNAIWSIVYGNNKFVAGSSNGKAAYSSDGITWTAISNMNLGTNAILAVAYASGKFVAGGSNGNAAYWNGVIVAKLVFNTNGTVGWVKS
jgi:hypothetical protein